MRGRDAEPTLEQRRPRRLAVCPVNELLYPNLVDSGVRLQAQGRSASGVWGKP